MRYFILLLSILVFSSNCSAKQVGNWKVALYPASKPPKLASGCQMKTIYEGNVTFGIGIEKNYEWYIIAYNPSWKLRKATTDVTAYVDGKLIASAKISTDKDIFIIPLTGVDAYKALQQGYSLKIQTAYGTSSFSLKGTLNAMMELLRCIDALNRHRPLKQAQPDQASTKLVPFKRASIVLANLLNASGVSGYKIKRSKNNLVNFTSSNIRYGLFQAYTNTRAAQVSKFSGKRLSVLSSECNGKFMSAKKTIPTTDGSMVRQLSTTCFENGKEIASDTVIIRKPDGFFMLLTTISRPDLLSPDSAPEANINQGSFIRAALKARLNP